MSSVIWKFPFDLGDLRTGGFVPVEMPLGARVIHAEWMDCGPCLWAICDPAAPKVAREIHVRGTGHQLGFIGASHIGTLIEKQEAQTFVWHLFE